MLRRWVGVWQRLLAWLLCLGTLQVVVLFVGIAVVASIFIVLTIDYLWDGQFSPELEFAGVLTPFLDGLLIVSLLTTLLVELRGQIAQRERTEQTLREAQAALSDSESSLKELFENMGDSVAVYEATPGGEDFVITLVNRAAERLEQVDRIQIIGRRVTEVFPGIVRMGLLQVFRRVWQTGVPEQFPMSFYQDGRISGWRENYVYRLPNGKVVAIYEDVTERKQSEERIEFLAHHDALTGLPNRLLIMDRFQQAVAHSARSHTKVALLFLDLDSFKTVNDSLGHAAGDQLLRSVAERLRQCVRETDSISRQGGDEFLIVLPDIRDAGLISNVTAKILQSVAQPFTIDNNTISVSASIGVAVCPEDGEDFGTLLKKADTAMYHAKAAGRNTCNFFDQQMNFDADERLKIRTGLQQGLERGEFVLHFQPQVNLVSGELVGAEALLRWNSAEFGLMPPGRFVTIAEECGLIVPIGAWVLREACRQAAAWQRAGLPAFIVAVNLSAVQFARGDIEQVVIAALSETGLAPEFLELELTESILVEDTENVLHKVQRMKALGLRLSIDDFGTGYSSLAYLKRFAVDKVKIDQSFIRDLFVDQNSATIVHTIIQMAHNMGLRTIAEGVEHQQQLDYLKLNHCDEAQGYLVGFPMDAEAFAAYLADAGRRD